MANTPHLNITLLEQAQAQKEVTVNEALFRIDAVLNSGANDKDLATPPATPVAGDVYIIPASPTGDWEGKAGQVAYFDQIWRFITPNAGLMLWVSDEARHYVYNNGAWSPAATGGTSSMSATIYDPANISQQLVGVSATQTLSNKTLNHCDATTQTPASNNTKIATTAYVDAAIAAGGGGGGGTASRVCEGRLTLASGTPVTSNDIVGATTLYFTPYRGNNISLWSGTAWQTLTFNEVAMPLSGLTANLPYDVFAYNNAGTVVLERLAWTSGTARATALTTQNGVLVRSGDATRRYLGTFCATGTTTTEDSALNRYVWNYYHRAVRVLRRTEMTGSWTYSTASWRQANGSTSNRIGFVIGVTEDSVTASVQALANNNTTTFRIAGVSLGIDSLTPGALVGYALASSLGGFSIRSQHTAFFTPGLHYIAWLEYGAGSDTQIWYGGTDKGMEGIVLA